MSIDKAALRQRLYYLLDFENFKKGGMPMLVNGVIILMIIISVVSVIAELGQMVPESLMGLIWFVETVALLIFTVEYAARFWSCVEKPGDEPDGEKRKDFVMTLESMVDLLAILPTYVSIITGLNLQFMVALRILRMMKLMKYFG